jgi:sigma-B regulation protein RsbU (phosphoserine phosphatase)
MIANEISFPAPVLGAFKKSKFSETQLSIKPGTAVVFYTDGIVEATNAKGEEIGYEGFKKILLESYDQNAEAFYQNVYSKYLEWLGEIPPQDDLTLVFLVNPPVKI